MFWIEYIKIVTASILFTLILLVSIGWLETNPMENVEVKPAVNKQVCIETHQTLNRNETQVICGFIVND